MFSRKQLIKLILPLVVEQFLAMTIGIADTLMVATCGEAAVSGISLVDSINILLINIFSALATGGAIVCSQYIGKEQPENARKAAKQLVLITAILSVAIMIACLLSQRGLLRVLFGSIEDAVMDNAVTYLFLSALSYPFIAVYNAGAALFRSMGNSKISMYASLMMNIVNVGGNALLIFQFNMGVAGAGLASLISRILAAVFVLYLLRSKKNLIRIENWLHWKPNFGMIKNILRIGIPTGLENGMFQIGKILVASLIASFGTASITANAVANSASSLVFVPAQVFLSETPAKKIAPYFDQIVAIVIALFMLPQPIKMIADAFRSIFLFAPKEDVVYKVKEISHHILDDFQYTGTFYDVVLTGRRMWISIYFKPKSDVVSMTLLHEMYDEIYTALGQEFDDYSLELVPELEEQTDL